MSTSPAHYRLLYRGDMADLRLAPRCHGVGAIDVGRWGHVGDQRRGLAGDESRLRGFSTTDCRGHKVSGDQWLRQPESRLSQLVEEGFGLEQPSSRLDAPSLETTVKYRGYLKRQEAEVIRRARH